MFFNDTDPVLYRKVFLLLSRWFLTIYGDEMKDMCKGDVTGVHMCKEWKSGAHFMNDFLS